MITTIQVHEEIRKALERLKQSRESYEDVIAGLIEEREKARRKGKELLIEGCKVMANDNLRIIKEWEATDASIDWEWSEDEN